MKRPRTALFISDRHACRRVGNGQPGARVSHLLGEQLTTLGRLEALALRAQSGQWHTAWRRGPTTRPTRAAGRQKIRVEAEVAGKLAGGPVDRPDAGEIGTSLRQQRRLEAS